MAFSSQVELSQKHSKPEVNGLMSIGVPSRWICCFAICCLVAAVVFGQTDKDATPTQGTREKVTLRGCLGGIPGNFRFASADPVGGFILMGKTEGLEKYVDREMTLEGRMGDAIHVEGFFDPFPSFEVDRIARVFGKAKPELSTTFAKRTNWQEEKKKEYGVKLSHPRDAKPIAIADRHIGSNFVTKEGVEIASSFEIPATAYANANFRGGSFAIFANRQITNSASCEQFGERRSDEGADASFLSVGGLRYSKTSIGSAAMGSWESDYYFHIFRNGLCYEAAFDLYEYSAHTADTGCNVPLLSGEDEMNLIQPLLASVRFFRPAIRTFTVADLNVVPQVTEFTASSDAADDVVNRGLIKFSWTTRNADYIEFSYTCEDPEEAEQGGVSAVVILENGPSRSCQNIPSFARWGGGHFYRSPNGSIDLGFGYFWHEDPTVVTVTITPFAHAIPFPAESQSVRVTIHPNNPFQRGVPTGTRNMTIAYEPDSDGRNSYVQGSPLTISWTDEREQDPCVNLYLVQDNAAGGANFVLQLNLKRETGCLKPARQGSYTWTVTTKYVGSGFRILASTPGGFSGVLGPRFDILRPATGLPQ